MSNKSILWSSAILMTFAAFGCNNLTDHVLPEVKVDVYTSGLTAPLGMEADAEGRLWVTEAGDGKTNNGQLSLITTDGKVFPVVTGFVSEVSPEGGVFGLNHLILQNNILWMLHGVEGKLYKLDISTFKPGDKPLEAKNLEFEDVGSFVKKHDFEHDTDASDLFSLTIGPNGDLFIVDAAANAVIRRNAATKELTVFAAIPPIFIPGGEPEQLEPVPTGIVFDGQKFFISNFSGYPFPAKKAPIYQVDLNGNVSVYQTGLSSVADIELDANKKPVVIEYGIWSGEQFDENSGAIVSAADGTNTTWVKGLNFPNSIERVGEHTYYIAQTFDGVIQKVTL
jgi:hypothetical protein